jgi:hypothetical protein
MIYVVAMKCLIGLPLLIYIELLWRNRSRSFKNRGVGVGSFKNRGVEVEVGVGAFVYRLHSPGYKVMKGTEYFVSLQMSVVITEEYKVTVNSEELIGTTEYLTQ